MTDTQPQAEKRPPRQEQEAASEEVVEVAPGVLRMQLPIWMPGLGHVNMYGLVDDRGLTVVDPGLPGPQSWKALKQRLKRLADELEVPESVVFSGNDMSDDVYNRLLNDLGYSEKQWLRRLTREALANATGLSNRRVIEPTHL